MLLDIVFVVVSLALLYFGADVLVRGASALAVRLGIPMVVVGLTVVAYGTSAPELVVSLQGALEGRGGIAAGNVLGSNIFNACVILGIAAMVQPVHAKTRVVRFDLPLMAAVSIWGLLVLWDREVSRFEAIALFVGAVAYTVGSYVFGSKGAAEDVLESAPAIPTSEPLWRMLLEIAGGLVLLVGGSHLLVTGAVGLATAMGVGEAVIGLTIVAAGTSMPELATTVVAARKGHSDIALGNVVGSSLFNILLILGLAGTVQPFVAEGVTDFDLWFMAGAGIGLWLLGTTARQVNRWEGALLLVSYGGYLYVMWP